MGRRTERQRRYRQEMREVSAEAGGVFAEEMRKAMRRILLRAIREAGGNLCVAAIELGIHRNTLGRMLKEIGLTGAQVKAWAGASARKWRRGLQVLQVERV